MIKSIEKSISVTAGPAEAFHFFFGELDRWWPREYTWGKDAMEAIGVEPRVDGLCFERGPYGFRSDWGRVLEWDPPHRVKLAWQISPRRQPEPNPAKASVVEIRFAPEGSAGTRVTVTHGEFGRHGEGAEEYLAAMESEHGWPYLLARFAKQTGATSYAVQ